KAKMDWSESTATAQRNWIGRSEGAEIEFHLGGAEDQADGATGARSIRVFTTRPDTLFGATFMVLAPEHPLVPEITAPEYRGAVDEYRRAAQAKDLVSRKVGDKDKSGVFTGSYATNPGTGRLIPVWVADYVLMEYGTGAIMAVPGHDERDFEFARKHRLDVVRVLAAEGQPAEAPLVHADVETAGYRLVNSGEFTGRPAERAKTDIIRWLERVGQGKGVVLYRLHDWCISRQRYWGPPIPIIYCDRCGVVPVPEQDLPVLLPTIDDFRPDDTGVSPLARVKEWYHVACPACGGSARRETDVSDTFLDSAWYFLRYPSTEFDDRPFDPARTRKWLPVSTYIGGNEHAVLHLLYSRFVTMVLYDLGHLPFDEPYRVFRAHGLIVKDGAKMSKSRGNVVVPDEYIARWGADAFRMYLMFLGPFEEGGDFRDDGLNGPRRFLDKLWALVHQSLREDAAGGEIHHPMLVKWHRTKKKATHDIERLSYNTAIAAQMELLNAMREANCAERVIVEDMVVMVAPFAPHFAEECWERLGHAGSVFDASWPIYDEALTVEDTVEIAVQVNGKTRGKVMLGRDAGEEEAVSAAEGEPSIRKFLDGKTVRKIVLVPNRLLNLVVE
ncbi:MAG TPA: leucine--tRNA ligase, partial [Gemmatimonadales bacterium]|nr:leucine--tRNA ligase [Gemmatimonadales bacterium]